ncbi:alpha/beta hydrolase [Nocardiopsis sp. MG754419]|uniref:alpha/beta hydrolase n=1 Tax=Nocardiopsis sp. MG754419 TaxID=2259865 RepID=UPI001BABDDD5|nr:alpha/beta hydrolase [Nocardiopsis sp. MG754419]MBR8743308.1 alpha/beta hydrolase [Nocardiopsis sp. MG754419]
MGLRVRVGATLLGAVVLVAGCTTGEEDAGDDGTTGPVDLAGQELDWRECDSGLPDSECAVYEVPLDYDEPDGERIEIAVKRVPATGDEVLGSLLVNPGGPGGSGHDFVDHTPYTLSEAVRERFDVVGFDPRGVGRSTPLTCLDAEEIDEFLGTDYGADDGADDLADLSPQGLAQIEEGGRGFVEACEENAPDLMRNVGTADVARDMDLLRALLGDERLTYLGASYGTHIGAQYAEQFPDRVRALVLDGAVDPSQDQLSVSVQQATGFETALRSFVEDCLTRPDCPLGTPGDTVDQGIAVLETFLGEAATEPLETTTDDGREVNRARAELGVLAALYTENWWPRVREALTDAMEGGDGTGLLLLGDDLYGRADLAEYENSTAALTAVNCSDSPAPRDVEAYAEAAASAGEESPVFGPMLAWGALPCAFWPEEAVAPTTKLTGAGADPIMVVGTTRDSATPYAWSESLAEQLESAFLLTRDGDGHTGYRMGDECVDEIVDDYLLELTVPEDGMACAPHLAG